MGSSSCIISPRVSRNANEFSDILTKCSSYRTHQYLAINKSLKATKFLFSFLYGTCCLSQNKKNYLGLGIRRAILHEFTSMFHENRLGYVG